MLDLRNKRILVTQASDFMGPAICTTLRALGADVVADHQALNDPDLPAAIMDAAGPLDAVILNLAIKNPRTNVLDVTEAEWHQVFDALVHPLPRLVKAAVPVLQARGGGAIVVMGSASALRGMRASSTYSAARGAQLAYVQAAGIELARDGIHLNAIAQNFVDNPTYFPAELQADPKFQARMKQEVPLGRLVSADEDASFAAYLCTSAARCFVGQVFPMAGGWVTR